MRKRAQSGRTDAGKKRRVKAALENGDAVRKNARDEEILSEDEDDFGNGGRAPVSDDDNDEEQEVDVETADEKRLRIAKAYIDRTRQAAADAVVRRRLSFFLSPKFQFPPLL